MTTHACPTCQCQAADMSGHDEALRNILHTHATFLTSAGQAIEAALAGETVEWPKRVPHSAQRGFLARYYPGAYILSLPTHSPRASVHSPDAPKKTIWSAS